MNDNYIHSDSRLIYVNENIPGPAEDTEEYLELINNFNSQLVCKCECRGHCVDAGCLCINSSRGRNYTFSIDHNLRTYKLNCNNNNINQKPVFECNDVCLCISHCGNRLVQKGPCDGLSVKSCELEEKGFGLFTKYLIAKGSFVCEYAGELITKSQAFQRHRLNVANKKINYIFCLNEHSNDEITQTFVDPSSFGNIGRYINHSCDPNCYIVPVRINSPIPKLAIFSLCDILPDQEITIDYGSNNCSYSQQEINDVDCKRKKCLCNTNKCKGMLPYESF
ncbi:unnamed protein product [Parnassius mnemosyne]|uniref:Histone-lysine N-methyltransferase SETMAR n=1 Tax=Parnassius mnemosyne TaxID=213953 RepID=A0AAV1LYQ9_9NEOP